MNTPRGLGRGLSSLLDSVPRASGAAPTSTLPLSALKPGTWQPRTSIDPADLEGLAVSIRAAGVIQPILVRPLGPDADGSVTHEIIAGERRWRAAQKAGLLEIPVVIRACTPREALAAALIENIQREELNALDEARALERLIAENSLTHEEVAQAVGRSRAAVSNLLRLLELPDEVGQLIESKSLSMGHARALLALTEPPLQLKIARLASAEGWSVRKVEEAVRAAGTARPSRAPGPATREIHRSAEGRVRLRDDDGRGEISVEFTSHEARDALIEAIKAVLNR